MKKGIILTGGLTLCLWGCITHLGDPEAEVRSMAPDKTIDVENALWHEATGMWIIPQKDPYTLANFQHAYNNLSSGNPVQPISRTQLKEFSGTQQQLKPTHYSIRVFPVSEKEQCRYERMDDIRVSYIPFSYAFIPDSIIKQSGRSASRAVSFQMPELYIVWPCDKPFLPDMDYEMLHEVFIPGAAAQAKSLTISNAAMEALENEALYLALGASAVTPSSIAASGATCYLKGKVMQWDAFLNKNVPLACLKINYRIGSYVGEVATRYDGTFMIYGNWPPNTQLSYRYEQGDLFKITSEHSTAPIERYIGTFGTLKGNKYNPVQVLIDESDFTAMQLANIHRAATFFYTNLGHEIPKHSFRPTRICAIPWHNNDSRGVFNIPDSELSPYISIYNNHPTKQNLMIGAVFHELGHMIHYIERGSSAKQYMEVHGLIKESFANYIGWNLGEKYYYNFMKYKKLWADQDITELGAQKWSKIYNSEYSPLFIDLEDDNDQSVLYGNLFPKDAIRNVPVWAIVDIATRCKNWTECKQMLQKYIGVYYSKRDLNKFIADYDDWFGK